MEEKKNSGEPVEVKYCIHLDGACMMPGGAVCSACCYNLNEADKFIDCEVEE